MKTLLDSRNQQSPSSSVCCSTGHNFSMGDESSYGGSLDFLDDHEIEDDNSGHSIDSAIIDDDNTEKSIGESDYDQGSATVRSNGGSFDYDPEVEEQGFTPYPGYEWAGFS